MAALRARVAAARDRAGAARARFANRRKPQRRRRGWWLLLFVLLILLASLARCRCPAPEPVVVADVAPIPDPGGVAAPVEPPLPPPPRLEPVDRPSFRTPEPAARPWLDAFRQQVTARGPRLARCFVGAGRPGALEWSAAVDPVSGRLSEVVVVPLLASDPLTAEQRACVVGVLSDPAYRLQAAPGETQPSRVGMTLEF
jgi:hypothetical protein